MNEALKLNKDLPITNARKIVDTRNKLIHGYDEVDMTLLWEIVIKHLPLLKTEIHTILGD